MKSREGEEVGVMGFVYMLIRLIGLRIPDEIS